MKLEFTLLKNQITLIFYKIEPIYYTKNGKQKIYKIPFDINLFIVDKDNISSCNKSMSDFLMKRENEMKNLLWIIFISILYYSINHFFNDCFRFFIENQLWFQSLLFGLVLKSTLNMFMPIGIKHEITEDDIKEIFKKQMEEKERFEKFKKSCK
jgi:hypothetical protein